MTVKYEFRVSGDIVRWCKHCHISNNDIPFLVKKDSKTGKWNKCSICRECIRSYRREKDAAIYSENRDKIIKRVMAWNSANRERFNKMRRKRTARKRLLRIGY